MTLWRADLAWVDGAVRERVALDVNEAGRILAVTPDAAAGSRIEGLVVPGVANLHCRSWQRALAGAVGRAAATARLLRVLTPDDVAAIAAQLYVECLLAGATAVGEFHLLHNAPDGAPYDDRLEMALAVVTAAERAGIGLTLFPVLQCRGGRRFVLSVEAYGSLCQDLAPYASLGVAPRSLAALTPQEWEAALVIAELLGPATPVQTAMAATPGLPRVDSRWSLVHATRLPAAALAALAATGAVAGLCPSSEAAAGEGPFPLDAWLAAGGHFGIGSGGNLAVGPVAELRRLRQGGAGGAGLFAAAAAGGAQALGRRCGVIAPGCLADLVVLDPDHPALVGRHGEHLLEAWLHCPAGSPVRHVMVAGQWVVRHGTHLRGGEIAAAFGRTMRRIGGAL
jgi:formimidoylglutamate deiminase